MELQELTFRHHHSPSAITRKPNLNQLTHPRIEIYGSARNKLLESKPVNFELLIVANLLEFVCVLVSCGSMNNSESLSL